MEKSQEANDARFMIIYSLCVICAYLLVFVVIPMLDLRITGYIGVVSSDIEDLCLWILDHWLKGVAIVAVLTIPALIIGAIRDGFLCGLFNYWSAFIFALSLPMYVIAPLTLGCVALLFCGVLFWFGGGFLVLYVGLKIFG